MPFMRFMRFRIDHFYHPDEATAEQLRWITQLLGTITRNQENIMSTLEELEATLGTVDTAVAKVKTDVETLLAKLAAIPTSGLTPEQQAAIDAAVVHAKSIADALGAIDTEVNPPAA